MDAQALTLIQTLTSLPENVNRYEYLLTFLSPIPEMPIQFQRNIKAIMALLVVSLAAGIIGLVGKLYRRSTFGFRIIQISTGPIVAFDTMSLWLLLVSIFCILGLCTAEQARRAYVEKDLRALLQFENLFQYGFFPLWICAWFVVYGTLVASLIVLNPLFHLPKLPAHFYTIVAIFIPLAHLIAVIPPIYIAHKHTIKVVDIYGRLKFILQDLAKQSTGFPTLDIDIKTYSLITELAQEASKRAAINEKQSICRLVFQAILLIFFVPASIIYLDALRKQIYIVLPRLRGELSRQTSEGNVALSEQTGQLSRLEFNYKLMVFEHIGLFILIILYTVAICTFLVTEQRVYTNGSLFNWVLSSLYFYTGSTLPFINSVMAWRSFSNTKAAQKRKTIPAHHVRVETEKVQMSTSDDPLPDFKTLLQEYSNAKECMEGI